MPNINKTAIETAIEDIKGYKSFGKVIDIDFVVKMLENVYLEMEKKQIADVVMEIDTELATIEDYAHGAVGNDITNIRRQLIKYYK